MNLQIPIKTNVINNENQLDVFFYNKNTNVPVGAFGANVKVVMPEFTSFTKEELVTTVVTPPVAAIPPEVDVTFPTAPVIGDEIILSISIRNLSNYNGNNSFVGNERDKYYYKVEKTMTAAQLATEFYNQLQRKSEMPNFPYTVSLSGNTITLQGKSAFELKVFVKDYTATITDVTLPSLGAGTYELVEHEIGEHRLAPYAIASDINGTPMRGATYRAYYWEVKTEEQLGNGVAAGIQSRLLRFRLYVNTNLTALITTLNTIV